MSTFGWVCLKSAKQSTKPRIKSASFGDGYEQRVGDGINNMPRSWNLTFEASPAIITSIENFLKANCFVSSFIWEPPTGAQGTFVCDEWELDPEFATLHTLTCTFREVFEP